MHGETLHHFPKSTKNKYSLIQHALNEIKHMHIQRACNALTECVMDQTCMLMCTGRKPIDIARGNVTPLHGGMLHHMTDIVLHNAEHQGDEKERQNRDGLDFRR